MGASSKDKPALKVATVTKRLVSALESIGFESIKARTQSMVMNLNDETEVKLYPGVERRSGSVLIDPVIVLYNTRLRERLLLSGWKGDPRVCHAHLGMLDSWGRFYVNNDDELEQAVHEVVQSVVEAGLPTMRQYDSLEKVKKLFHEDVAQTKRVSVAVLFAKQKLEGTKEH